MPSTLTSLPAIWLIVGGPALGSIDASFRVPVGTSVIPTNPRKKLVRAARASHATHARASALTAFTARLRSRPLVACRLPMRTKLTRCKRRTTAHSLLREAPITRSKCLTARVRVRPSLCRARDTGDRSSTALTPGAARGPGVRGTWRGRPGTIKQTMRGANLGIMCVQFSKNDELIMAGANDNATRIWAVDTGRLKVPYDHRRHATFRRVLTRAKAAAATTVAWLCGPLDHVHRPHRQGVCGPVYGRFVQGGTRPGCPAPSIHIHGSV